MNKQLFIIKTHSFVDLITNSSSELFVCDSNKTVEMVKEILIKLVTLHNEKQKLVHENEDYIINISNLFTDVFEEPYIAKTTEEDEHGYYGYSIKPGDLVIRSASDNSIPYDMFDAIESVFCAKRYHLG